MSDKTINSQQGHWILAKMGKKVLRPGGKELTQRMIDNLGISSRDTVVEFAPGMGFTAALTIAKNPKKYVGIELNEEAAFRLQQKYFSDDRLILNRNALDSGLPSACADKLYGEAMLTMQADQRKSKIIKEAWRLLKPGGYYGIHELGLQNVNQEEKKTIQTALAKTLNVNARPLTEEEWRILFEQEGFKLVKSMKNPMLLLEKSRIIDDEGLFNSLKIFFNIMTHSRERKKILQMRELFRKYEKNLCAFSFILEKQ